MSVAERVVSKSPVLGTKARKYPKYIAVKS
jgi:hypothetical protein